MGHLQRGPQCGDLGRIGPDPRRFFQRCFRGSAVVVVDGKTGALDQVREPSLRRLEPGELFTCLPGFGEPRHRLLGLVGRGLGRDEIARCGLTAGLADQRGRLIALQTADDDDVIARPRLRRRDRG